jgi:hypothetical protein
VAWAIWLAAPVVLTLLVACWVWVRSRPPRAPTTAEAMRAHRDYLDALTLPARGASADRPD